MEGEDAAVVVGLDHAEFGRRASCGAGMAATVTSARFSHVVFDHAGDVHAVDVIAAEDRHHVRVGLLHQVDVLIDRVGRALVPGFVLGAHLRRHRDDELVLEQAAELPALAQVLQQRLAAELRQHIDRINSRVDEVAQGRNR